MIFFFNGLYFLSYFSFPDCSFFLFVVNSESKWLILCTLFSTVGQREGGEFCCLVKKLNCTAIQITIAIGNIETIKEKLNFVFHKIEEREKRVVRERDTAQHLKNTDTLKKMNRGDAKIEIINSRNNIPQNNGGHVSYQSNGILLYST